MFVGDKIIYLQLQKTGSTHIASLLAEIIPGKQVGKHGPLRFERGNRLVFGSIRNPWDWYVSLWAYGCGGKGGLYTELTTPPLKSIQRHARTMVKNPVCRSQLPHALKADLTKRHNHWKRLYENSEDPVLFREWLGCILADKPLNAPHMEGGYPFLPLRVSCGLYAFRFLKLFTQSNLWRDFVSRSADQVYIKSFYDCNAITSHFVRMESIEDDLERVLRIAGYNLPKREARSERTNASTRRDYRYYYDNESIEIVGKMDRLIIEKFDYSF